MQNDSTKLVTLGGECVEFLFERTQVVANRDGVFHLLKLTDASQNRGVRLVSVYRFGPKGVYAPDYDSRIEAVCVNVIRRAIDTATVSFASPVEDCHTYLELSLQPSDFAPGPRASDAEVRQFILHKAFWLGFRYSPLPGRAIVQFDEPIELDYLGVSSGDVRRNAWLLAEQGMLESSNMPGIGRPTAKLIEMYEARASTALPNETLFPKGTQYEAFKKVSAILRSARLQILIADNYLNEDVLDMLAAVPAKPSIKLLTFGPSADFKVAAKRFQAQYQQTVQIRLHNAEIHDRAIVIDDVHFYMLGGSIKDMGAKLTALNRVEEPSNITKLRIELQRIWGSALSL